MVRITASNLRPDQLIKHDGEILCVSSVKQSTTKIGHHEVTVNVTAHVQKILYLQSRSLVEII